MIRRGYVSQIVLGTDRCRLSHLHYYGGEGYDHVLVKCVPLMKAEGVTDEQIRTMMVENPRRLLAF